MRVCLTSFKETTEVCFSVRLHAACPGTRGTACEMVETKARIGKALNADRILLTSRGPSHSPVKPVTEVTLASDHMESKGIEPSARQCGNWRKAQVQSVFPHTHKYLTSGSSELATGSVEVAAPSGQ